MKTPMQELIDEMQKSPVMFASALTLIEQMRMLEKEKKFICMVYDDAVANLDRNYYGIEKYGELYYNGTFNTEEK